jgi:uncharacterized protein YndB with AHSA1/START domain
MSFIMHGPNGEQFPNTGVYLEVVPDRLLVSTDAFTPGWKPAGQPFMVSRVELEPTGDGQTRLRAIASHWNQATMDQHLAMGFPRGLGPGRRPAQRTRSVPLNTDHGRIHT